MESNLCLNYILSFSFWKYTPPFKKKTKKKKEEEDKEKEKEGEEGKDGKEVAKKKVYIALL